METKLSNKKCVPCEKKGSMAFDAAEASRYAAEVPGWILGEDAKKITREFTLKDFLGAMDFINAVADIAEAEGHHPDIYIFYNKVRLELSTHSVGGLSENDFIMAAKISDITRFH
jgi:4a-hydroxytetrahydrobiopterin dehydratase